MSVFMTYVIQKLQLTLQERDCELLSVRHAAQEQQRTIQSLSDSIKTRDNEVCAPTLPCLYICFVLIKVVGQSIGGSFPTRHN